MIEDNGEMDGDDNNTQGTSVHSSPTTERCKNNVPTKKSIRF